ncbi:hypothetical protein VNI00_000651 [Paramarasmius palmivorus]|uniref:DUF6987 domain-containing protein n=1 Tax=Paramarasmius palmivorus TaxID=297713 RepID=A0AAW0E6J6_9AGAR
MTSRQQQDIQLGDDRTQFQTADVSPSNSPPPIPRTQQQMDDGLSSLGKGSQAGDPRSDEQKKKDAELAERLSGLIEDANSRVLPLCRMIRKHIETMDSKKEDDRDERELVEQVKPLLIQAEKILNETQGTIKGADPDNRLSRKAQNHQQTHTATPEEQRLAAALKVMAEEVGGTIEWAKNKLDAYPKAKKDLGPLLDALGAPLTQIISGVCLLLGGVLNLVGKILSGLGLDSLLKGIYTALVMALEHEVVVEARPYHFGNEHSEFARLSVRTLGTFELEQAFLFKQQDFIDILTYGLQTDHPTSDKTPLKDRDNMTQDFDLWPNPALPPSQFSPVRLPGTSPESTKTLREVLRKNHEQWHCFYDELGRHNHISHHTLAVWALGAHQDVVRMGYDKNEHLQQPKGESPGVITKENWKDSLGDRRHYSSYIAFFTSVVKEIGSARAVEQYVLSHEANFGSKNKEGKTPEMLSRLQAGIMHAHIHVGYGAEFGLPGMVVEGLAEAAVSEPDSTDVIPATLWDEAQNTSSLSAKLSSVLSLGGSTASAETKENVTALDILNLIITDTSIQPQSMGLETMYADVQRTCGAKIAEHVNKWSFSPSQPSKEEIQSKIEELHFALTLMYAVPGYKGAEEGQFNADFLSCHFVTSGIFAPSLVTYLSPINQVRLLKGFFGACLSWYVSIGKPRLDLRPLFGDEELGHPRPPEEEEVKKRAHRHTLPRPENPNPWTWILREAIVNPDDHVPKCQRALAHYANLYGAREKASFSLKADAEQSGIKGIEELDGTLFLRAAALTQQRLGRDREEVPKLQIYWDRRGYMGGGDDSY